MPRISKIIALTGLLVLTIGLNLGIAQPPPPPPPPGGPPCWPPPCIPVDGGIVAAACIAGLFGVYLLFNRTKTKAA